MSKTYNKGEWSEIYAMFKLLGDKKMSAGDENLKKIPNLFGSSDISSDTAIMEGVKP